MKPASRAVLHKGRVHPALEAAAHVIMGAGWRVTSIYRPDGSSHRTGRALDAAPLVYQAGGLTEVSAKSIYDLLRRRLPRYRFTVVAETDHVHVELARRYPAGFGILTRRGVLMTPET